jgi:hypothetical protein
MVRRLRWRLKVCSAIRAVLLDMGAPRLDLMAAGAFDERDLEALARAPRTGERDLGGRHASGTQ